MQRHITAVERVEQALWRAGAQAGAPPFATPVEAWQAGVMRAIRLAVGADRRFELVVGLANHSGDGDRAGAGSLAESFGRGQRGHLERGVKPL